MYIYVVETGCKYEGGSMNDVYFTYKAALSSKPSAFSKREKNSENFNMWLHHDSSEYFCITKIEIKDKSTSNLKMCKTCKLTEFEHNIINDNCYACDRKLRENMDEALE